MLWWEERAGVWLLKGWLLLVPARFVYSRGDAHELVVDTAARRLVFFYNAVHLY